MRVDRPKRRFVLAAASAGGIALLILCGARTRQARAAPAAPEASAEGAAAPACTVAFGGKAAGKATCHVIQPSYDNDASDPVLAVFAHPVPTGNGETPELRFAGVIDGPLVVGALPSIVAIARAKVASDSWEASRNGHRGVSVGTVDVSLSSVRRVGVRAGRPLYEVHGTLNLQLLPTVEGSSTGFIDATVTF